jgi:hypothetical protein
MAEPPIEMSRQCLERIQAKRIDAGQSWLPLQFLHRLLRLLPLRIAER